MKKSKIRTFKKVTFANGWEWWKYTFSKVLIYKLLSANTIKACTEYIFLKQINPGDIIYLWPGTSLKLFEEIEKLGNTIVFENINCHQQLGKKILDSESQRINLIDSHAITTEKITDENNKLQI